MRDQFYREVNCASSSLAIDISFHFAYSAHANTLYHPTFQGFIRDEIVNLELRDNVFLSFLTRTYVFGGNLI